MVILKPPLRLKRQSFGTRKLLCNQQSHQEMHKTSWTWAKMKSSPLSRPIVCNSWSSKNCTDRSYIWTGCCRESAKWTIITRVSPVTVWRIKSWSLFSTKWVYVSLLKTRSFTKWICKMTLSTVAVIRKCLRALLTRQSMNLLTLFKSLRWRCLNAVAAIKLLRRNQ